MHKVEGAALSRVFYKLYASRDADSEHESSEHMKLADQEVG